MDLKDLEIAALLKVFYSKSNMEQLKKGFRYI